MSRTKKHKFTRGTNHRANELGICNCPTCKAGRSGKKIGAIIRLKRKLRNWKSNRQPKKGCYTD